MTTLQNLTQAIINEVNGKIEATTHLNNERTLESHFEAIDRFEQSINVLAMNNRANRYKEIETENGTKIVRINKRESANAKELWNGRLQYTMYKSESDKYLPKEKPATASIKVKKIPQVREYKGVAGNIDDFKPSLSNVSTYKVENYHFYNKAIVLDLIDTDKERESYQNRELPEKNPEIVHLVFRYAPFDRTGKPNKYDGITQLRDFLHKQNFIVEQNPTSLKEALNILVGYTVNFPSFFSLNYTSKSDLMTVYSVYGDFTDIETELSK